MVDLSPLFETAPSSGRRLIDQLDTIRFSYLDVSKADVGDPMVVLAPLGFQFKVDMPTLGIIAMTATRTTPAGR